MNLTHIPSVIWNSPSQLGESPVWDDQRHRLYWLDIKGRKLHILSFPEFEKRSIELPIEVSAVALRLRGGLIAATKNGFAELDPETGTLVYLSDPESHLPHNRFNDAKCDAAGNFIAGSMDELETTALGSVYRLGPDGKVTPLFGRYIVCNGPAFSPDGKTLYFSDSAGRTILKFDYDLKAGILGDPSVFARIPKHAGYPDGLCVDSDGYLWCAHWDGWRLTRFAPDGYKERVIEMPVPHVTCCTFGGEDLKTLFITTARTGLSGSILLDAPLAGSLFALNPGVSGLSTQQFAG